MEAKSHAMCVVDSTICCSDAPLFFKVMYALLSSIIRSCCLLLDILPIKKEMTLMAQLDYIEKRGSGLTRICNETKALEGYKDELKPVFKSTPTQFQTTIYASSDTPNVGDSDGDMSETKLTERQQKILNLIKESPTITGKQMSETLSVSQRTIERDLSALQKLGVLKREGKDNDGVWVLNT